MRTTEDSLPTGWWTRALRSGESADAAPDWVAAVERAVAAAPTQTTVGTAPQATGAATLGPALAPFVAAATAELVAHRVTGDATVPAGVAATALHEALSARLARTAARTLVVELHRARDRGGLAGDDPRARFSDFVSRTATAVGLRALVTAHPVLARLLGQCCVQETRAIAELVGRFTTDRAALVADLLGGADPGPVTHLAVGAGDRHGGGRAVAILRFTGGAHLVYKPRPVTMLEQFAGMLAVLEAGVPQLAPRVPRTLAGDGYGWAEFIPHRSCTGEDDVERFYRRQGAMLALLHALDATDAHCENLIACGDQPVLVDVETLLHPTPRPTGPAGDDPALRAIAASVLRTALLPRPVFGEIGALDLSGLGGGGALTPDPVARWADAGTDRMHLVREPVFHPGGSAGPTLDGAPVDVRRHRGVLLAGFHAAYDVVRDNAATLLAADGPIGRCGPEPTRFVVRDTATYSQLLDESTHPDLLRSPAERESALLGVLADDAPEPALVGHELADLWAGDIPLFTTRPDSRDVVAADGSRVRDVVDEPVLERVRRKISAMDETDRERQEWMIKATLGLAGAPAGHRSARGLRRTGCAPATPDRLLAAACAVGDQVVALAEHDERRANWVGMERIDERFWTVLPLGAGLGEGYPGVALFLAQLGAVTGIPRYTDLARRAVAPLPWLVSTLGDPERAAAVGCGAFTGVTGICYALARLATLLRDPAPAALLPAALATVLRALPTPGAGPDADLARGVAALRAVHAETGQGAEALAGLAGRRPDAGPPGDGTGWCSGAAGLAAARLAAGDAPDRALVAAVAGSGPLAEHSMCHGEAGVLDVLLELGEPGREMLRDRAAQLLADIADGGPRSSTPAGLPTPGLLSGLSGVGHTLLRLARPTEVPSVLMLHPTPGVRPDTAPTRPVPPGTTAVLVPSRSHLTEER